jgi:hypothetical protein
MLMPTLRRTLKYMPAVVLGLLVVAWAVSWFGIVTVQWKLGLSEVQTRSGAGSVWCSYAPCGTGFKPSYTVHVYAYEDIDERMVLGRFGVLFDSSRGLESGGGSVPYLILLPVVLPFVVGSITAYRFRLWHYLAYTTLVAVELAYYLRWQE